MTSGAKIRKQMSKNCTSKAPIHAKEKHEQNLVLFSIDQPGLEPGPSGYEPPAPDQLSYQPAYSALRHIYQYAKFRAK